MHDAQSSRRLLLQGLHAKAARLAYFVSDNSRTPTPAQPCAPGKPHERLGHSGGLGGADLASADDCQDSYWLRVVALRAAAIRCSDIATPHDAQFACPSPATCFHAASFDQAQKEFEQIRPPSFRRPGSCFGSAPSDALAIGGVATAFLTATTDMATVKEVRRSPALSSYLSGAPPGPQPPGQPPLRSFFFR